MAESPLALRDPNGLRAVMDSAGLDTVQLAKAAGVTKQFLSLLLHGRRRCKPATAMAIAQAIGQPLTSIFMSAMYEDPHNYSMEPNMTTAQALREEDPLLTFEEVAELARMPIKTLRHHRATGAGPDFFRTGRRLKIRKSKAEAWIRQFENA